MMDTFQAIYFVGCVAMALTEMQHPVRKRVRDWVVICLAELMWIALIMTWPIWIWLVVVNALRRSK